MSINYIDTAGGKLAVEVAGDGPLIICSPALGDTRDAFAPLAAHLVAGGFRVACIDLRGHGDSSARFDSYGDEAAAEDFLTLTDALWWRAGDIGGLCRPGRGYCWGRRPDRVAGLILLGPFLRNSVGRAMRALLRGVFMRPWGPYVWRAYATRLWPGLGDKAGERAASSTASLTRPGHWPAFRATFAGSDHSVVSPWIGRVEAPVLVVMGYADPDWSDPLKEARWVASNFTDVETIVVPGAGHAPMFERPAIVNPAVSRFLIKIGVEKASMGHDA